MAKQMNRLRLPPMPTVREIIRMYRLRAKKQLSQNFLLDGNISRKIVSVAGDLNGCHVCEVGPGPGSITRFILEGGAKHVAVIEKDSRFIPGLQMLSDAVDGRVRIFHGDVLCFDMDKLFPDELVKTWDDFPPSIHIIGNLPFSISTPLIIQYLEQMATQTGLWRYGRVPLTLTFQKEVAERMVAQVADKQRTRLSIMCQYLCRVKLKFVIPGRCFVPAPDVDVGVVNFQPVKRPLIDVPFKVVEKVVRHVFHTRQKMIRRGIQTLFPPDHIELVKRVFEISEVDPTRRSYSLSIGDFRRLCLAYSKICDERPELYAYDYRSKENAPMWRGSPPPVNL